MIYIPAFSSSLESRHDQETWNLVGMQPVMVTFDNVLSQVDAWITSGQDAQLFTELRNVHKKFQELTYDKLSAKSPRPSEQVRKNPGFRDYPV